MKLKRCHINIILCALLILILFLLWIVWNKVKTSEVVQEGIDSDPPAFTLLDADLCYNDKCLGADAKDRLKRTLTSLIYKNNLDVNVLDTQTLGLWEADNPSTNNQSIFTIRYKYGTEDKIYDLSFKELSPMNLENYRNGELVIQDAKYCYTETDTDSKSYGKEFCVKNTKEFAKYLNSKVTNNTLIIDKISPDALGVLDPAPDTKKKGAVNMLEVQYAYNNDSSKTISLYDGEPLRIKPSV